MLESMACSSWPMGSLSLAAGWAAHRCTLLSSAWQHLESNYDMQGQWVSSSVVSGAAILGDAAPTADR